MGAAPRTSPTPTQVAHSFVSCYYRVTARLPHRLGNFYGTSSELDHGEGFCARGPAIADLGDRLPISGCSVTVRRLSVQATGDGAFVVVVIGSYLRDDENIAFTQTFILEKQVDSHDEHYFCRNDIFAPISENDDNVVISVTDSPRQAEAPAVQSEAPVTQSASTEEVQKVPVPSPVTPPKQTREAEPVPTEVRDPAVDSPDATNIEEIAPMSLPDNAVNGTAVHEEPVSTTHPEEVASHDIPTATADSESASETTATGADETPLTETALPNGGDNTEPEVPKPAPAPPVKKTWASIVSSRDEIGNSATTTSQPVAAEEPVAPKPAKEQLENVPPAADGDTKNAAQSGSTRPSGPPNGHRPAHHVSRGNQRSFGPSAVVQLSALSQNQLQDTRGLVHSLRDEFGNYGYKLRNVDVKAQKGIAFVEYETLDGVKAAVAQWANGPKNEGPFAGIALQVSEKRVSHGGRRPGSVRGGRGGSRGGRRPRPNSTPLS